MIEAYAVADVRDAEARAIADLDASGVDGGDVLMQRAAKGLAQVARARVEERGGRRVVALVGGGNNGGDALFALARLARRGYACTAVTLSDGAHPRGMAAARARGAHACAAGSAQAAAALASADLVLDGITGIGGRPGLDVTARESVDLISGSAYVLAVDLPSGADPAGRVPLADAVFADETVTFGVCKPVHLLPATELSIGRLTVIDIGLDLGPARPAVARLTRDDVTALWPVPGPSDDKYSRGVVGVVAGSLTYPGAGVLCTLGALGAGPGMVRYLGPDAVAALVHQSAPEVVSVPGQVQAWVLGPGLDAAADSTATPPWGTVDMALAGPLPALVDAGALDRFSRRDGATLLTPHAGEAARLLSRLTGAEVTRAQVDADRLGHARALADHTGATVLLKGSATLVVPPSENSEPVWVQADAPAWTGTAGSGDVLAGIIGTLLAAGLPVGVAGALGALVHGLAAERSNPGGPVRPPVLAATVPQVIASLARR